MCEKASVCELLKQHNPEVCWKMWDLCCWLICLLQASAWGSIQGISTSVSSSPATCCHCTATVILSTGRLGKSTGGLSQTPGESLLALIVGLTLTFKKHWVWSLGLAWIQSFLVWDQGAKGGVFLQYLVPLWQVLGLGLLERVYSFLFQCKHLVLCIQMFS